MERLSSLYGSFLSAGLLVLRQAVDAKDFEWANAEIELLHNVPSLIDEPDMQRHRYFWFTEREHYIEWANSPGHERAKSRMNNYYAPLWAEMAPILQEAMSIASNSAFGTLTKH